jgi:autotransporter-associated beta strand protein
MKSKRLLSALAALALLALPAAGLAASSNADLSNLVPSDGTLSPAFASGTISYTASVPSATTSMTVTPTVADATATITVNGNPVTSGSPSGSISLNLGANVITNVVTAQDTVTTKTYTLTVTRVRPIYWDPASSGSFGSINGTITWVSPLNLIWTTAAAGNTTRLANRTTTLNDECNWGGPTAALGGGTVPVGTVEAGTLSFNTISGSGTVTLSGGRITLRAASSISALSSSQSHTISSTLAGAATSLTKIGAGTIVLSGINAYTGSTIVSAGILSLGNSLALQSSTVDATTSITGDTASGLRTTVTTLTLGGLSGSQDFATLFTTTAGGFDTVTALTLNPATGVTSSYSGAIADGASGMALSKNGLGTQVLAGTNTYTGATTVNAGTLTLDYSTADDSKLADGAALVLGSGRINLTGGTHLEAVGSTTLVGATSVARSSGAAKLALGAITGAGTVDFSAPNIATTTTGNDATGILGPWATINSTDWAMNDGSGNIVTYTGYTDVQRLTPGTIASSATSNVRIIEGSGSPGDITMAASGTTTISTLLQSAVGGTSPASINVGGGNTLQVNTIVQAPTAGALTIGLPGTTATLQTATPGGLLYLNIFNAAQPVTLNAAIADNTTASGLSKGGAGTLALAGPSTYTGATLISEGTLQLSGSLLTSSIFVDTDALLTEGAAGVIGGTATLTLGSTSTSTLAGTNTYSGATTINNGVVNIQNGSALGSTAAGTTLTTGSALQLQGDITVGDEALTLSGTGVANGGALRNISGNNTYGGLLTLGSSVRISSDAGTLTFTNTGTITGSGFGLTIGGAGDTVVNSVVGTDSGLLAKDGTGRLTLTGPNTFTGSVTVTAGALNLQNSTAAGTAAGGVTVGSGATLELQGGIAVGAEQLTVSGTGISNGGALRNISGDNSWGGAILAGNTSIRINSDSGTLTIDVASGNAIASSGVAVQNPSFAFGGSGNVVVADPISSNVGPVSKDGSGTLTLSGANTYTSTTTVSAGTLLVNGSLSSASAVTVAAAGTLGGTGTVGGSVTNNGTISAGASVGPLNTGNQTWNGGATNQFEVSSAGDIAGRDLLNITGALDVQATSGSPFTIKLVSMANATTPGLVSDFNASLDYTWVIATASGGVLNFDASKFAIDTNAFVNTCSQPFSVAVQGNNLVVNYGAGAVLTPPVLSGYGPLGGTSFPLTFSGPNGQSYRVLSSTNVALPLASWTTRSSGLFGASPVTYTDTSATNATQFYRIQSP